MATLSSTYSMQGSASTGRRAPSPGGHASGHGVEGVIATVAVDQPLAADDVWRVTLEGEPFGRLVSRSPDGSWHLLQLDELTEPQLDALEAAAGPRPPF